MQMNREQASQVITDFNRFIAENNSYDREAITTLRDFLFFSSKDEKLDLILLMQRTLSQYPID